MIFDLIAGMNAGGGAAVWTPAELFKNGEEGFWFDGSDMSTMFQGTDESTPVTAAGQPVGLWKNKVQSGSTMFKYSQSTASNKPLLEIASGKSRIMFDGVDDRFVLAAAPAIVSGSGNGVGIGYSSSQYIGNTKIYGWSDTYLQNSLTASEKLNCYILGRTFETTNTQNSPGTPNSHVMSGSNTQVANAVMNEVVTVSGGTTTSSSNSMDGQFLPVGFNMYGHKISQFIFINRALTPEEVTLLEAFIRSKQ